MLFYAGHSIIQSFKIHGMVVFLNIYAVVTFTIKQRGAFLFRGMLGSSVLVLLQTDSTSLKNRPNASSDLIPSSVLMVISEML